MSESAMANIKEIGIEFKNNSSLLYRLVKAYSVKGKFQELFLRLDFNSFYDKSWLNLILNPLSNLS